MRTLLMVLGFLCFFRVLAAQYVVINVNQSVYADDKLLKKKDKIDTKAKLRFSSPDAFAHVMQPGKGYYILGVKDQKKVKGEFVLALKDALLPPDEYYAATTRANAPYEVAEFQDQYDLKAFFRERLFFIAPAKFKVSAQHFPLDSNHFFMIRHQLADGWMGKPLPQADQTFELTNKVLQLHDKVFTEQLIQYSELYFVNKETGEEQYLGRFTLQFPASDAIKEELKTLRGAFGKITPDQFLRDHAMPYLNLQYGKTQAAAIAQLVAQIQE